MMYQRRILAGAFGRQIAGALLLAALTVAPALAANGTITGTVKDASGTALKGAFVVAYDANNNTYRATAGDDGTYSIGVPPGTYSVTATGRASVEATLQNIAVADGQTVNQQDVQLKAATPFPIVKAAAAIPLTSGIDATEFANAQEIQINQPWQVVVAEAAAAPNSWRGPQTASGRLRLAYDATNLYVAGDLTFAANRLNSNPGDDPWKGNALEIYLQNDPYDPNRTTYDSDHDWQLVIGLGPTPAMKLYGTIQADAKVDLATVLSVTDKPDNKGVLVRANLPWSMFLKGDQTGITSPADEALGAIGFAIDAADPKSDPTNTTRLLQLAGLTAGATGYTDPSTLRPAVFTAKAP
jgi:hypothetical protein